MYKIPVSVLTDIKQLLVKVNTLLSEHPNQDENVKLSKKEKEKMNKETTRLIELITDNFYL